MKMPKMPWSLTVKVPAEVYRSAYTGIDMDTIEPAPPPDPPAPSRPGPPVPRPPKPPENPLPEKTAVQAALSVDELQEYEKVAEVIGLTTPVIKVAKLRNFLASEGITFFSLDKVEAYMHKKFAKEYGWSWFPLRAVDKGGIYFFGKTVGNAHGLGYRRDGETSKEQYAKEIPMPVLLTVKKIVENVSADVCFYVAAEGAMVYSDPFLMVAVPGAGRDGMFVIERWDEPSFRG